MPAWARRCWPGGSGRSSPCLSTGARRRRAARPATSGPSGDERGAIVLKKQPNGEYVQYLPRRPPKGILVIAHGSVEEEGAGEADIRKLAQTFLQRWTRFADEHALIAVAPLFDHNFGSWIGEARHRARRISRPRRQGDRRRRARGRHCGAVPRPARRRGAVLSVRPLRGRPVRGPLRRAASGPSEGPG